MPYTLNDLRGAANAGVIGAADLDRLLAFLSNALPAAPGEASPPARFDAAHLLWYAGALIVIGAMGLFSTVAFSQMGGRALTACAVIYAIGFTAAGHYLWHRKNLRVPGGLLVAIAVSMAPLAVYGIQDQLGWWGKFGKPAPFTSSMSGSKAAGSSWKLRPLRPARWRCVTSARRSSSC